VKILLPTFLAIPVCLCLALAQEQQKPAPDFAALGRTVMIELGSRQFDKVAAQFDERLAEALPQAKLAEAWDKLVAQAGTLKRIRDVRVASLQTNQLVTITCEFEKATLDAKIAFRAAGRIGGLSFVPSESEETPSDWAPPDYAKPSSFHEQPAIVADGQWELPATLTLPAGNGPFPAVVLVQGSGPHDRDETIGPNKPFKDLAWGLDSRGIAVLRYTKRTLKYSGQSSVDPTAFTVKDETIDDARAGVALLAHQPNIDPKRIFLLGHSLGGYLAPRIAAEDSQIAGIMVMAGNTRPIEQLIVEQVRYMAGREGKISEEDQKHIDAAEEVARQIESQELKAGTTINVLGSITPNSYWIDLRGYQPAAIAAGLKVPVLVMQGGRDYQVGEADFDGWKKALDGHANATLKFYPSLNHLFITGTGPSSPAEYARPGHVSQEIVQDIAAWVTAAEKPAK
jgi:dienelactone hydrolase